MTASEEIEFVLDRQLAWDSEHVLSLELCELRLVNDRRWPWLLLIPQRAGLTEIHELELFDQTMLAVESGLAAATLKAVTGCEKINSGALGNVVSQLHIHVVARSKGDPNWPNPVWGFGQRVPYGDAEMRQMIEAIQSAFDIETRQSRDVE